MNQIMSYDGENRSEKDNFNKKLLHCVLSKLRLLFRHLIQPEWKKNQEVIRKEILPGI